MSAYRLTDKSRWDRKDALANRLDADKTFAGHAFHHRFVADSPSTSNEAPTLPKSLTAVRLDLSEDFKLLLRGRPCHALSCYGYAVWGREGTVGAVLAGLVL